MKLFGKIVLSIGIFLMALNTVFLQNIWFLLTEPAYIIPEESSVFKFTPLIMNEGSGDWWLYGEDEVFFYTILSGNKHLYLKIRKDDAARCPSFKLTDIKTWCKASD